MTEKYLTKYETPRSCKATLSLGSKPSQTMNFMLVRVSNLDRSPHFCTWVGQTSHERAIPERQPNSSSETAVLGEANMTTFHPMLHSLSHNYGALHKYRIAFCLKRKY